MSKHLLFFVAFCMGLVALQAQSFVVTMPGYNLHCRVFDAELHQAEVDEVTVLADTAVDISFPEKVKHRGVRYDLVSTRGGLLKNNPMVRSLATGDNMQYLGSQLCYGCKQLRWVSIGKKMKEIGCGAFALCYNLDSLSYNAVNCHLDQSRKDVWLGCYGLRRLHLGDDVEVLDKNFICHCSGLDCELRLPPRLRHIGENAFGDCSSIRGTLVLPPSLETVGGNAFAGLNSVDTLIIQSRMLQVPTDEHRAFYHSVSPVDVIFDTTVVELPAYIFTRFYGLRSLRIPSHIEVIPSDMCIYDTNLHEVRLPDSLRVIGRTSFYSCGLEHLEVPSKVFMIENYALAYNYRLSEVVIGESVRFVGDYCFVEDTALRSVTVLATEPPRIFEHTFSEVDLDCVTLHVPAAAIEAYRRDPLWNRFTNIIPLQ